MTPAPLIQPEGMITQVAVGCGVGRTRINGICVARTTIRHTRRAVRRRLWRVGGVCAQCEWAQPTGADPSQIGRQFPSFGADCNTLPRL